jgi:hypothetical protein
MSKNPESVPHCPRLIGIAWGVLQTLRSPWDVRQRDETALAPPDLAVAGQQHIVDVVGVGD